MPTAYERANAVYQCWLFSLYVQAGLCDGDIKPEAFHKVLKVSKNGKRIAQVSPLGAANVLSYARSLSNIAEGTCFIAFDEAFDEIFGEKPGDLATCHNNYPSGTLRVLVYMMRCAFAHNPALPVWKVERKYKNVRLLEIPEIRFSIDVSGLNGMPLSEGQHEGKSLIPLMKHCLHVIENHGAESASESA